MDFEITNTELRNEYTREFISNVPVFDASELSYNDFFSHFMQQNVPCIIRGITNRWQSSLLWLKDDKPNFEYLSNKYGCSKVTIYNCKERYFNSQKTEETVFADYLNYWQNCTDNTTQLTYLKDWHLKLQNESDDFYQVPIYFASDWLNEYYTASLADDYRFVYMGTKNTWTPFHVDVFTSYSWSANICGQKKWLFFPPGEENLLKDNLGNLPYDVSSLTSAVRCIELIQEPGEVIFVPSGWYHQVLNLDDTISVNHNWVNGCNIIKMWESMMHNFKAVQAEIKDCAGMEGFAEHCQVMLNASFGMDYCKFYEFIKFIGLSRLEIVEEKRSRILFHSHRIGKNHVIFDLKAIRCVLEAFVDCDDVNELEYFKNVDINPKLLLTRIVTYLENI